MRQKPHQPKDFNSFWEERVENWLINDVHTCIENWVNIGATTLIFCYVDFLGSLVRPKANSRDRFYRFIEEYFAPANKKYDFYKCKLYEDFRCGLVHEAIMKKGTGIFRSPDPADRGYKHLEVYNNALWIDLIQLEKDFVNSAVNLKKDIDTDPKIKQNAINRLRYLKWELPEE